MGFFVKNGNKFEFPGEPVDVAVDCPRIDSILVGKEPKELQSLYLICTDAEGEKSYMIFWEQTSRGQF